MRSRRGQFQVTYKAMRSSSYKDLKIIFEGFIPHYIDNNYSTQVITYMGEHPAFKEIVDSITPTSYSVVVHSSNSKVTRREFKEII